MRWCRYTNCIVNNKLFILMHQSELKPVQIFTDGDYKDYRLLFVYGTLMRGFGNHYHIKEADFVGDYRVRGTLYTWGHGSFPFLVKDNSFKFIKGEIYLIDSKQWASCLRLEGRMYVPKQFEIQNQSTLNSLFSTLEKPEYKNVRYEEKAPIMCHYFETNQHQIRIEQTTRLLHGDWGTYKNSTVTNEENKVKKVWEPWTTSRKMASWELPVYK